MPLLPKIPTALFVLLVLGPEIHAAQTMPPVYRDEYVTIHAGVEEIGMRPIHIGDAVSFIVQLIFDADRVRVETLDSDFFQRAFASKGVIKLYAAPVVTHEDQDDGQIVIRASWPFQILGCPQDLQTCPGNKFYDLPIVSVSYQIIDEAGNTVNDKSVRFRPWPGTVAVSSTLADPKAAADNFLNNFPGGAHPEVAAIEQQNGTGFAALIAGILLVVAGFNGGLSEEKPRVFTAHSPAPANRWQHAFFSLKNESMPDDQWADLLRRCASWYCLDELGRNPYAPITTDFDRFFAEVLDQEGIEASHRGEYLSRFTQLAELEEDT